MNMFVEVHITGRNPERHELIGERITLGTREDASIRFSDTSGFGVTLVEVFPSEGGVRVNVPTGVNASLTFDGTEHREVRVPFGSEVFVGTGRLTFLKTEAQRRSPVLVLALTVALLGLGLHVYKASSPEDPTTLEVTPPELFAGQTGAQCPESRTDLAAGRAQNDERAAYAKFERSAFEVQDGVEAANFFQQARTCYEIAGRSEDATRMGSELQRQTERLNEQYATFRLRLRVALDKDRYGDALEATRGIEGLLSRQADGPYRRWLARLEKTLERKTARGGSSPFG